MENRLYTHDIDANLQFLSLSLFLLPKIVAAKSDRSVCEYGVLFMQYKMICDYHMKPDTRIIYGKSETRI